MSYLLPRSVSRSRNLAFVLAFGDLSYLEVCTVLGNRLQRLERPMTEAVLVESKDEKGGYERLAGVHKVAVPVDDLEKFLGNLESDEFNFSISLYRESQDENQGYEEVASKILDAVRQAGFRRANLVRPRQGTEVLAKEISSRRIIDFVVLERPENYWIGATSYVPNVQQFQERSNERPVVSSEIAISSRLARLLVNLSGVQKGQMVLDPFCGSGTILAEALLVGANCIGFDRNPRRIENAERNLEWVLKKWHVQNRRYSLEVGDALKLEALMDGEKVDAVVTEPIFLPRIEFAPNLEKARKLIRNSSRLYSESLYSIASVIRKGGRVVIVAPSLRSAAGKDVSVMLENLDEVGLRPFQPSLMLSEFAYPVRISNERTRWVRRLVYVFERI